MDPRSLPKETTLRFVLIVFVVLASLLAIGESLWYTVYQDHGSDVVLRCASEAQAEGTTDLARFRECQRPSEHERVVWTVGWTAVFLAGAVAAAAGGSALRRRGLTAVPVERMPAVASLSSEVSSMAGRRRPLPLFWRPSKPVAMARADGVTGQYVEVGPAFLAWAHSRPDAAGAVLQHEYGHHQLRDVLPSRITLCSGYVLAVAVVPFAVTVWDVGSKTAVASLLRLAVAGLLVAAARAAVLRAREIDADLESADRWPAGIVAAIGPSAPERPWWRRVVDVFAHHPSAAHRQQAVAAPARICRLRVSDAVLVGLASALAGPVVSRLWRSWFQFGEPAFRAELVGWGLVGLVLGAWLAAMILRAACAARATGERLGIARFAWVLGLSVLFGQYLFATPLYLPVDALPRTLLGVIALASLGLGLVVALLWTRGFVELWLDTALAQRSRGWGTVPVVVGGSAIGALLLGVLGNFEETTKQAALLGSTVGLDPARPFTIVEVFLTQVSAVWVTVLLVMAAVVPLAVLTLRVGTAGGLPAWLHGEGAAPGHEAWPARRLVAAALLSAVVGGIAGTCAFALYTWVWDPIGHVADRGWYEQISTAFASQGIAAAVVAAAAAGGALVVGRAQVPLAGLAGGVGAVLVSVGLVVTRWIDSGHGDFDRFDDVLVDVFTLALVGALLGAALVVACGGGGVLRGASRALALLVPVAGAVVMTAVGVQAIDARPSHQQDLGHLELVMTFTQSDVQAMASACAGATPVTREAVAAGRRVQTRFEEPDTVPSRADVRPVHRAFLAVVKTCVAGLEAAYERGDATIDPGTAAKANDQAEEFQALATAAGLSGYEAG